MNRKQTFDEIDFDRFQSVADRFIERSSHEFGEMLAPSFFESLFEKMAERVTETIELEGEVVDNKLVLRLPAELETAVHVQDNEILIGDREECKNFIQSNLSWPFAVKRLGNSAC